MHVRDTYLGILNRYEFRRSFTSRVSSVIWHAAVENVVMLLQEIPEDLKVEVQNLEEAVEFTNYQIEEIQSEILQVRGIPAQIMFAIIPAFLLCRSNAGYREPGIGFVHVELAGHVHFVRVQIYRRPYFDDGGE